MTDHLTRRFNVPADALAYEIVQEQAAALGRLGRALEQALVRLRAFDAERAASAIPASPADKRRRHALLTEAGEALWLFVVQRESCGLRDSRTVMRDYKVPVEVEAPMGAFPSTVPPEDAQ